MAAERGRDADAHQKGNTATAPARRQPPQLRMGLLDYITAYSLDEDYAHAARRRDSGSENGTADDASRKSRSPRPGVSALLVLGIFGLLMATSAVQTSRNAVTAEAGRQELVAQIAERRARVDATREQVAEVRAEVEQLQTRVLEDTQRGRALSERLERLGARTGALAVEGPGVRVVVDDAPNATGVEQEVLDEDLQKLANALWQSGAEAISINGQRLTNLTAIRLAGSAVTVNYRSLARPYVVSAIGDPNSIPARFVETDHGSTWLDLQAAYGLQFDMTSEESLTVPAANRLDLRHASIPGPRG